MTKNIFETIHLLAIDKAIEEGGGWAKLTSIPGGGGQNRVMEFILRGILEEKDGYVRRAANPEIARADFERRRDAARSEEDEFEAKMH